MKIRYLVGLFLTFIFLPSIFFVIGNTFFYFGNFVSQKKIISSLESIFGGEYYLQKGNIYYRYADFENAINNYENYKCKNDCDIKNHNLGNSYYRLGETESSIEKKVLLYLKSVFYYKEALNIKFNEQTKFNHDFVLEKLRELQKEEEKKEEGKKEEEEKKEEQNQDENNDDQNGQQEEEQKQDNQEKQENNQEEEPELQPKGDTIDISKDYERGLQKLEDEDKQMLEEYLEQLKNEEKQNRPLNNKKQNEDIFDILRGQFFEDFDDGGSDW